MGIPLDNLVSGISQACLEYPLFLGLFLGDLIRTTGVVLGLSMVLVFLYLNPNTMANPRITLVVLQVSLH